MHARVITWNNGLFRVLVLGGLFASTLAITATAQPNRGPALPPEVQAKVNAAQVSAVAADLKLDAEKAEKLGAAVKAFQENEMKTPRTRPERGDWEGMRKIQDERIGALEGSLKEFLDDAQAAQAAQVLAGQNRGWDNMVQVLLDFGLEAPKEAEALGHTLTYVKTRPTAAAGQDNRETFEAMRATMLTAKTTLDESIAPLLTEEQKATWAAKTNRGPREGGRGGDGERGERGERERRGGERSE